MTGLRPGNPSGPALASEAVHREPDLAADTPHTADRLEVRAWLAAGPLPAEASAWIEDGGTALLAQHTLLPALDDAPVLWSDDDGRPLLRGATLGAGRALQWTRPLQSQAMPLLLDAGFPLQALRGVPLVARSGSLVAHLLEEKSRPLGFKLAARAEEGVAYDGPAPGTA